MATRSFIIRTVSRDGPRYDIRTDSMVTGRWQFCIRVRLGWPMLRWGWAPKGGNRNGH